MSEDAGRPGTARPRDALGRPLAWGAAADRATAVADAQVRRLETAPFDELLAGAQRLLDANHPFHAHEVLEAAWKRAPEGERDLWRALAQLAVAITHDLRGNPVGARSLMRRSTETLEGWSGREAPHDIAAAALAENGRRYLAGQQVTHWRLTASAEP